MARYAIVDSNNIVINVIEGNTNSKVPIGFIKVQTDIGDIGNIYIPETKDFDKSNQITPEKPQVQAKPIDTTWQRFTGAFRRGGK